MRVWMLAGAASVAGGGAWVGGAFDQGEFYPMAPAAVEARLAGLQLGSEAGSDFRLALRSRGPALLRWDIMAGTERMAEVRANLSPDDGGTRVAVDFQFLESEGSLGMEEDPFLNDIAEIAMTEKIDSALDGRAFNAELVQARMAAAIAANPGAVANMQKNLQKNIARDLDDIRSGQNFDSGPAITPRSGRPARPPAVSETHADGGWGKKN